jgi:hypothetical protein
VVVAFTSSESVAVTTENGILSSELSLAAVYVWSILISAVSGYTVTVVSEKSTEKRKNTNKILTTPTNQSPKVAAR